MEIELYLYPTYKIDKLDICQEELNLNIASQVPHWQFLLFEDVAFGKEVNGEKPISRKHFNKFKRMIKHPSFHIK